MKHFYKLLLTVLLVLTSTLSSIAYDFEVDGIYYNVLSKEDLYCEVTKGKYGYIDSIVVPSSVEYLGKIYSVKKIGNEAFDKSNYLLKVSISEGIEIIGDDAFSWLFDLNTVELPSSLKEIGSHAFAMCLSLTSINIPDGVTKIGSSAFWHSAISSINLPSGLTKIEYGTFSECENLKSITIPSSVTEIGERAFNKTGLTSIEIPESIKILQSETFQECSELTIISLPSELSSIGSSCFAGCISVQEIKSLNTTPPTANGSSFGEISKTECVIKVPNVALNSYQSANGWKEFWNIVGIETSTGTAETVSLNKSSIIINIGETVNLTATVSPENSTDKTVTWSSSNSKIAKVSSSGVVTAVAAGTATITAKCGSVSATCTVTVLDSGSDDNYNDYLSFRETGYSKMQIGAFIAKSISFELVNNGGKSIELTKLVIKNKNTGKQVTSSEDASLLGTLNSGEKKALSVTVNTDDPMSYEYYYNYKGNQCMFNSADEILAKIVTLDKTSETVYVGETLSLAATVFPWSTTNNKITWTSSDESVAKVSSKGEVTAVAKGKVTITATTTDGSEKSASCEVTVLSREAESVTLNKTELTMKIGDSESLTATVLPENTLDKTVTWTTSDENVATVDADGVVTAVAVGTATITATCGNVSATCTVTVNPLLVESISLNHTTYDLQPGEKLQLEATVLPENATNKEVVWSSNNEDVVIVSSTGKVVFVDYGDAVVTATAADGSGVKATCTFSNVDGIEFITVETGNVEMFTLDGINSKKANKGIYIMNGKKVLIK